MDHRIALGLVSVILSVLSGGNSSQWEDTLEKRRLDGRSLKCGRHSYLLFVCSTACSRPARIQLDNHAVPQFNRSQLSATTRLFTVLRSIPNRRAVSS